MAIAADDAIRLPFNGAFDHPVVIGIISLERRSTSSSLVMPKARPCARAPK